MGAIASLFLGGSEPETTTGGTGGTGNGDTCANPDPVWGCAVMGCMKEDKKFDNVPHRAINYQENELDILEAV